MNDVKILFLPADIWQGVQAMGIAPADVAAASEAFMTRFTEQDIATIEALQSLEPVTYALGSRGFFSPNFSDKYWDRFTQVIRPLSETSYIKARVMSIVDGPLSETSPPIRVVDLGPGAIGVVMGQGTLAALRQDNHVLAILQAIIQKALVYGTPDALMASGASGFMSRFIAVNAYASSFRPPSPVFR